MKGKKVFLISSLLAALGLVGGTFAAWAVTDNANPFSVKITPGTLDIGGDKSVTLDWGTKGLVDIENLEVNKEKGPYEVGLKATTSDTSSFKGNLSVTLSTTATGEVKLINYLTVKVYDDAVKTNAALLTVPEGAGDYEANADITVTSGVETKVYFFINLSTTASAVYNTIKTQTVTMTVDWNKASDTEIVTARTYYFNKPAEGWASVYAYSWRASDNKTSAAWPGTIMKQEKGNVYSIAVPDYCDKIIFHNNNGTQTDDLSLPSLDVVAPAQPTPYWDGDSWEVKPNLDAETVYYLVGTFNEWTTGSTCQLQAATGSETIQDVGTFEYTYKIENVNIPAGAGLKIVSSENTWYAETSTDGGAPNMTIGEANHYDFFFNPAGSVGGRYIFCKAHA